MHLEDSDIQVKAGEQTSIFMFRPYFKAIIRRMIKGDQAQKVQTMEVFMTTKLSTRD